MCDYRHTIIYSDTLLQKKLKVSVHWYIGFKKSRNYYNSNNIIILVAVIANYAYMYIINFLMQLSLSLYIYYIYIIICIYSC